MSTITTIASSDTITSSRTVINTNFSALNTDKIETSVIDTDTALAANSDAKIPSQKAVKAYIDTVGGVNASTTARGVVEEATQAEVDAGTAAGGTGARLFINPSTTTATNAVKGFTYKQKVAIDVAETTVANTATETTLFSEAIPAGTLSTNRAIRMTIFVSDFDFNNDVNQGLDLRLKYGSTTICTCQFSQGVISGAVSNLKGTIEAYLVADGATNAQKGSMTGQFYFDNSQEKAAQANVGFTKLFTIASGTAAEDSTGALNLIVTADWGSGAASTTSITGEFCIVELIA